MRRYLLVLLCAGCLLLLAGCDRGQQSEVEQPEEPQPALVLASGVAGSRFSSDWQGQTAVDATGTREELVAGEAAERINIQLREIQDARLQAAFEEGERALQIALGDGYDSFDLPYYTWDETGSFTVTEPYVSAVFDCYSYVQGAAHPMTYRYGCTFDPATGERLHLRDFWGENAGSVIPELLYAQVAAADELDNYNPELLRDLRENLSEEGWYTDGTRLYIIYNPYEVAAYAWGIREFTLPLFPIEE